jgi:NADH-quinone oxidoreductase subunit M
MNQLLNFPFLSIGVLMLGIGIAFTLPRKGLDPSRKHAVVSVSLALVCFIFAWINVLKHGSGRLLDPWTPWLEADSLDCLPIVFYCAVAVGMLCLAPRRDIKGKSLAGMLILVAGTEITYAASNLAALNAGWWLTCVPFVFGFFGKTPDRKLTSIALVGSSLMLTLATIFLHTTDLAQLSSISSLSLTLFLVAIALRKGLFPLHSWVVRAFDKGPLLPVALLFNSHLGALLISRSESVTLPAFAYQALDWLSMGALVTASLASLRAVAETKPRRLLAFVCISQASFILAGLSASNTSGVMGGMLHWMVVTLASSGLIAIVRILEVRVVDVADPTAPLGLAVRAPRLATFFLLCGLALVGLPGTLGYCAEDLLFHGAQESHPILGISLLVATAFNAINLMRLYSLLFLGVLPKHVIEIPDALPRERWPLTAAVVFLLLGGIFPALPVSLRKPAADAFHYHDHSPDSHLNHPTSSPDHETKAQGASAKHSD